MSKAEYRYYELPQDLPLLVLTGEKWETIYGMDNMHFHNYLEIGYCHYGNGSIQFAEKELPYHAGTLTFIPKKYANMPPSEYLNVVRINKACELLAHKNVSIEEAARSVGYPVLSTFLRNFRKITGLSPSAWRKKALQNPQNITSYQISVLKGW